MAAADVVRSYFRAFDSADPDAIAGHVTDDFVNEHTATLGSSCTGKAAYRERLPGFLTDMQSLQYTIEDLVVDGDRVGVFYVMTAQWQGTTPVRVRGAQRLVIRDGLIAHRTDYWDSSAFLAQIERPGS